MAPPRASTKKGTKETTGAINPRTGKRISAPKEIAPSLQQQVYLASLERERKVKEELEAKQDHLQLYGEHKEIPVLQPPASPKEMPGPDRPIGFRPRSTSPINDELDNLSPRSRGSSAQAPRQGRPVNSAGLQIGVPLMGKETREGLAKRVSV